MKIIDSLQHKIKDHVFLIYREIYPKGWIQGKILAFNNDLVVIVKYDEIGEYDGIHVLQWEDIIKLRTNCKETDIIMKLLNSKFEIMKKIDIDFSSIRNCIENFDRKFGYIKIYTGFENSDIVGKVVEIDNESVLVKDCTSEYYTLLYLINIRELSVDGKSEKNIQSAIK